MFPSLEQYLLPLEKQTGDPVYLARLSPDGVDSSWPFTHKELAELNDVIQAHPHFLRTEHIMQMLPWVFR